MRMMKDREPDRRSGRPKWHDTGVVYFRDAVTSESCVACSWAQVHPEIDRWDQRTLTSVCTHPLRRREQMPDNVRCTLWEKG